MPRASGSVFIRNGVAAALFCTALIVCGTHAAIAQASKDCLEKSGDVAIAACTEAIRQNPRNAINFYNRATEYGAKGDDDRAIADFSEAIRLNPKYANAYFSRGDAYSRKKELA